MGNEFNFLYILLKPTFYFSMNAIKSHNKPEIKLLCINQTYLKWKSNWLYSFACSFCGHSRVFQIRREEIS